MAVTDEDWANATLVVARLPISLGDYRTRDLDAARDVIAAALAAEREKARAPFSRLSRDYMETARALRAERPVGWLALAQTYEGISADLEIAE